MRGGTLLLLSLALVLALATMPAAAQPVHVEIRSATGVPLGRLSGHLDGKIAYFALPDVARLVRGTARFSADGERATLALHGRTVEVRRESPRVLINGRVLLLSTPPRLRERTWMVPGELVVKALPALLGAGVQVNPAPSPPPAPPVAAPVTAVSLPPLPPRGGEAGAAPKGTPVALRVQSYPTYTRVVVEGTAPADPELRESERGLTVPLPELGGAGPRPSHAVRDGLVESVELAEAQGQTALRVAFDRPPAGRRVFRLQDPPRLVLDFQRAAAVPLSPSPGVAPPGAPPAPPPSREVPERTPPGAGVAGTAPPPESPPGRSASPPPPPDSDGAVRAPTSPVRAGAVELRYRSYPTYTRVVLEGTAPFEPRLVDSGGALVVSLGGLTGATPRAVRAVRDGLIALLELTESRGRAALRVSFERTPAARKVYRLQDPPRLVLDFHRTASVRPAASSERAALHTIVIDPGHGGHDPGAVGPGGLREKELTLDIARRLAALVQEDLGVKVVLTRPRDQFVALRERTAFANRQKADLFVSIHVNAAPGATATGTETYFLSSEATDNAARAAAAFENKVIALEAGPRGGSREVLRSILWDLAQSEFQQESSRLAEALQDSLERALRQPSRGVKQAPFYVLGGAAMPAVLVEIGFLSNVQEEQRLRDEGYRDRIARALAAGLATYKRHYDRKSGVVIQR